MTDGTQLFAIQRWSDALIVSITGIGLSGLASPLSTTETAIGITAGVSFASEQWRTAVHYQFCDGADRQHLFTTGVAGPLTPGVTLAAHYRLEDGMLSGSNQRHVDALAAFAVRPHASDRAGLLFSWNYGDGNSPVMVTNVEPGQRVARLSADEYFQACFAPMSVRSAPR